MAGKKRSQTAEIAGAASGPIMARPSRDRQANVTGELTPVRSMPESLAAEAAVLGSMIIDPDCIGQVVELLGRDAFYRIEHRNIFDALIGLKK